MFTSIIHENDGREKGRDKFERIKFSRPRGQVGSWLGDTEGLFENLISGLWPLVKFSRVSGTESLSSLAPRAQPSFLSGSAPRALPGAQTYWHGPPRASPVCPASVLAMGAVRIASLLR